VVPGNEYSYDESVCGSESIDDWGCVKLTSGCAYSLASMVSAFPYDR
jgi:hypothetical protein